MVSVVSVGFCEKALLWCSLWWSALRLARRPLDAKLHSIYLSTIFIKQLHQDQNVKNTISYRLHTISDV